ncbi:MAG: ATP-dependent Clp protease ATP-binding subunit [Candidatus Nomurabacteria bacterium]|nr:MAG: ATP-dependent Clp protease ATP-binding subunit [Candidatus Nomurabacteria bacterium]
MEIFVPLGIGLIGLLVIFYYVKGQRDGGHHVSTLGLYANDLTHLARQGKLDPVIGRSHEIHRLIQILSRRTKNNPVLIGYSGVGKTAIVEELASEIANGKVPETLKGKRVLALDLAGLVAGTKYRGEFEKRLKTLRDEIIHANRTIILFIDEIHTLAEAGEASGAIDAADILKPALARGELQVIGASTPEEYTNYISRDSTLERRFQPVAIEEPSADMTLKILYGLRSRYEKHHGVRITDEALNYAVQLSNQKLSNRHFPDKAIDVIDEAAAKVKLESLNNQDGKVPTVIESDILTVVQEWEKDNRLEEELQAHAPKIAPTLPTSSSRNQVPV